MKSFFTKTSSEREATHLYEHIFLTELDNSLMAAGYLPYLDYLVGGESLRGEIEINFSSSSPTLTAKRLEILQNLDKNLRFTPDRIKSALNQILAEKREDIAYISSEIVDIMSNIRRRKWREGVAIDIDLSEEGQESRLLRFAESPDLDFYVIPLEVSYRGDKVELGVFLSRIVMEIFCKMLSNEFSCCFDGASDEVGEGYVSLASMLLKADNCVIRKEMLEKRAKTLLETLKKPKNLRKIQKQLKNGPIFPIYIERPDERYLVKADWSKYANLSYIAKALGKIQIRILEITTETNEE